MTRFMLPVVLGMALVAGILWFRVDSCRASSPTGQCAIMIDSGGLKLAAIQWPKPPT